MGSPTEKLYETRREEVARDFFRYLHDFSNGGWYGGDYRQEGPKKPHLLRADYHQQDAYFMTMFSMAHQLLENAHEDSGAHRYWSLMALASPHREERKPASQWTTLFPEVEEIISAKGPEVRQAFQTVFDLCRIHQKTVEDTPAGHNGKTITREKSGLTQGQADMMHDALLKIWAAYPETDTRISEGFDTVMGDPVIEKAFRFSPSIGGVSGYVFYESNCNDRSDHHLVQMLEGYDGVKWKREDTWKHEEKITPEEVGAIAKQTIKNLETLEGFAKPIAERTLAAFLRAVLNDGQDIPRNQTLAQKIFENITSGTTTAEEEARKIGKGKYGPLAGGYAAWLRPDEKRQRALYVLRSAQDYLKLCTDVHSGEWFKQQRSEISTLCRQKNIPGFEARPVSAAPAFTPRPL
ncbi:MAG: hypothetical protein ACK4NR_06870 [Micavibrio sp.]